MPLNHTDHWYYISCLISHFNFYTGNSGSLLFTSPLTAVCMVEVLLPQFLPIAMELYFAICFVLLEL